MNQFSERFGMLEFQQELNDKFEQALNDEQQILKTQELVLRENCKGFTFIIPIHQLQQISSENLIESVPLASSWIAGFNQVKGEVFTIVDFSKLIDYFFNELSSDNKWGKSSDSSVIYIKDYKDSKLAIMLNTLSLKNMTIYHPVFKIINTEKGFRLENILKHYEADIHIIQAHEIIANLEKESKKELIFQQEMPSFLFLLGKLADELLWDDKYQRPIIKLDMEKVTNFLNELSPY